MAFGVLATVNGVGDFLSSVMGRPALVNSWLDRGLRLQRRAVPHGRRARGTGSSVTSSSGVQRISRPVIPPESVPWLPQVP
jgi:hypothetical protein